MRKRITLQQNLINHVGIVYDASVSMQHNASGVVEQSDQLIKQLKENSEHFKQETRASMYIFGEDTQAACYDVDVLRTPSLKGMYEATGHSTALIDAIYQAITEMQQTATIHGDHAFLLYVLTDGQENSSHRHSSDDLKRLIAILPDNWTIAAMVPTPRDRDYVTKLGLTYDNVLIWDVNSEQGMEDVTFSLQNATTSYYTARQGGLRSASGLFTVDTHKLSDKSLNTALVPIPQGQFYSFVADQDGELIRDAVERHTNATYVKGSTFYELTKPVEIQEYKQICIMDPAGQVFTGRAARNLLGLPDYRTKVAPASHPDYTIFIQSTSVNRKLVEGTEVLVLK